MSLYEYYLPKQINVGLSFESTLGCVPEYECREVAVYSHCPWHVWVELDYFDRALAVAHYRIHHLIETHVHDAVDKASKRKQRLAERNNRRGK